MIVTDWEDAASDIMYFGAAYSTKIIGQYVAHLVYHMYISYGIKLSDIHIIGYSLGAHV